MAQNEIQKYTSDQDFYSNIRNVLETWYNNYDKLEKMSNFLNTASAADYPTIPTATLTDIGGLRILVNTYLASTDVLALMDDVKTFIRI